MRCLLSMEESESRLFPNERWLLESDGERPSIGRRSDEATRAAFRKTCVDVKSHWQPIDRGGPIGISPHMDFNAFMLKVEADAKEHGVKLPAKRSSCPELPCTAGRACGTRNQKVHKAGRSSQTSSTAGTRP